MLTTQKKFLKSTADIISVPLKRSLRLYTLGVSAGTGNFLDSNDYTDIDVDEFIPQEADFAVHITGDSMTPMFTDKQIVYVHIPFSPKGTPGRSSLGHIRMNLYIRHHLS